MVDHFRLKTDPARLPFHSTAELTESEKPAGQSLAMEALTFGATLQQPGYNLHVIGAKGTGKHRAVHAALEKLAYTSPPADDWCYLHNFDDPLKPKALRFPSGEGAAFKDAMVQMIGGLLPALRHALSLPDHKKFLRDTSQAYRRQAESALRLMERAAHIQIEKSNLKSALAEMQASLREKKARLDRLQHQQERLLAKTCLREPLRKLYQIHGANPALRLYLDRVVQHLMAQLSDWLAVAKYQRDLKSLSLQPYQVNLIAGGQAISGAPLVNLSLPSLSRLLGKLTSHHGDVRDIRPGALHQANGGFLLIEALDLLQQEAAWSALKRTMRDDLIRLESLHEYRQSDPAPALMPEPIPLQVKLVLFGEAWMFEKLQRQDPDFTSLFKIQVDFAASTERSEANGLALLSNLAVRIRRDRLRHLDRGGAARLLDEASRLSGDASRISLRIARLHDLIREADSRAASANRLLISDWDIEQALLAREGHHARPKSQDHDLFHRRLIYLETEGKQIGQINALTTSGRAGNLYGVPTRITASVGPGQGRVVDIVRNISAGSTQQRGAQSLAAFLTKLYAPHVPLSLLASLAYEQCSGPIDGDSAHSAEVLALLSAIADIPLRQDLAVTGAMDQHGRLLPIGSLNHKIEGYFDICVQRGLKPGHGVIIPRANVVNLMLKDDIAEAARRAVFNIYPVDTIHEAITLLTDMDSGIEGIDRLGHSNTGKAFPRNSFHRRVTNRLTEFARPRLLRPIRLDRWW